jgi:hypothetical protein
MTGKFGVEVLETRDTPTTFTGPLGGTVTAESSFQNGAVVQSVVVVGPEGNTLLTEQGQFVVNPRTGAVTGTVSLVGVNGNVGTGTLTGQFDGSTLTETTVFTGANGQTWTQNGVYVGDGSGSLATATTTVAGPNGGSKSGSVTADPTAGTVTIAGTLTGPNGRSVDWNRTVPV